MTGSEQTGIRCVLMRGGTSKGLYFHEADLPGPGPQRDAMLLRLMGSPDVLQIDGLGGSRPITSKAAIIAPSAHHHADVDYTFAQVEIDRASVGYAGNCGNISSGVGPFAVDEGLVEALEPVTRIRIFNTNTQALIVAEVPVRDGRARVTGDLAIPGVPGTGAEIVMNWVATIGAKTGRLLPTGRAVDEITLETGATVQATLCDAGNACVWVLASELGRTGSELAEEINEDAGLIGIVREIRGKAAVQMGLATDWARVDKQSPGLPMVGLVAPPEGYRTLSGGSGAEVEEKQMDLRVRLLFMNRLHESIAGSGSICLAAASRIPGSVVEAVTAGRRPGELLIGHPSGITPAKVEAHSGPGGVTFDVLGFSRTARRLMDGTAYYPPAPAAVTPRGPAMVRDVRPGTPPRPASRMGNAWKPRPDP
jgi:2-methylaconitate cis-trans-isomerase PrpF